MKFHEVDRLADHAVLPGLVSVVARDRTNIVEMLAFIAVADERKLYLPAAYPSMFAYCVGELRFSEDETFKRTQAARAARRFPAIFPALAEGRLHLTAVGLLAPHLTAENADELLAAARHKTKGQIECLLAERFPKPDVPTLVWDIAPVATAVSAAPEQVKLRADHGAGALELGPADVPALEQVSSAATRSSLTPLSAGRFAWQLTVPTSTNDKLRYAQQLLGHAVPGGEVAEVLDRALDSLIEKLEKRVFAASSRPRPTRGSANARHVPAAVQREVWVRDGGQCTFESDRGHRCEARTRLQFDHVDPVARGGDATPKNLRLLCRAHNQHAAECTFGKGFMREKRQQARRETAEKREAKRAREVAKAREARRAREVAQACERAAAAVAAARAQEIVPWLRELGCRPDEARRAAAHAVEALPGGSLQDQVHCALKTLAPASARRILHVASAPA